MKAFAVFAALGFASALAAPADVPAPDNAANSGAVHDLLLNITSKGEDSAVIQYLHVPGIDLYGPLGLSAAGDLDKRDRTVNLPAVGERITVAFRIASITIIRVAAGVLSVEMDNLRNRAISVVISWASGEVRETIPGSATSTQSVSIGSYQGDLTIDTSVFT